MTLKELQEKLAKLQGDGRTKAAAFDKLDAKAEADRSDDETAQHAALAAEVETITASIQDIKAQIAAAEAKRDRDRLFASSSMTQQREANSPARVAADQPVRTERVMMIGGSPRPAALGASRAFDPDPVMMMGFHSAAEFASVVRAASLGGAVDDRLLAADLDNAHTTGGASGEGYMVPPELREAIWEIAFADDGLLSRFDPEPTARNRVENGADETTPWGSGGVQAYWRAELEAMNRTKLSTEGRDVKLEELYALVEASEEMLEDAPLLNSRLTRKAGEAIRWKAVESFINGTGVGQPLGYRNTNAVINVTKDDAQAADTISVKNIVGAVSRALLGPNDFWLAGQDALPELIPLTIGDRPIYTPPMRGTNTMVDGGVLFGRPVVLSQHAEKLGDAGDLTFVNPRGYASYTKQSGIQFASSIHLWFDRNARAFRWIFRLGGQPHLKAPVSAAKGKPTMSHFVQIAARA